MSRNGPRQPDVEIPGISKLRESCIPGKACSEDSGNLVRNGFRILIFK